MSDVGQILQGASRGSKLSLSLYDFAATIPSATTDAAQLAKGTKDLSRSLWQVGVSQKEDARIASNDARDSVADIVQQCQLGFTEIEAVVPLDMMRDGTALMYGQKWEWSDVSRTKVQYLLGHLDSLRLTLEVMSQAVKSVKVLEWSWQQPRNMISNEAVNMDRLQLEGLVVDQQLAFLKASQLFDAYQLATGDAGLALITQDQGSQALTLFEEHAPNPRRLMRYQDTTLAESGPSRNETEQLALVRRATSDHIDFLLERWTKLREIRKQQQPTVDSDESSDDDSTPQPTYSNGTRGPLGPLMTPLDEAQDEYAVKGPARTRAAPAPIPDFARRARVPLSPGGSPTATARSWNPGSPAYLGAAPPVRAPGSGSGSHSTPTSPRGSFSAAPPNSSLNSQPPKKRIPWRLRVDQKVWDHENEKIVKQNCSEHPSQVQMSRNVATEILAAYVSEETLKEKGHRFDRYMTDTGNGQNTKLESLFSIRGPLTFPQVQELVRRTEERYEQRFKRPRPRPHLDHATTAPLPTPGPQYLQTPTDRHQRSSTTGAWDDGGSSRRREPKSNRSSASSLGNTSESELERDLRSGSRSRTRRDSTSSAAKKNSEGKTAKKLIPVAAGAGIASLLGDVLEGLSVL